MCKRKLIAQKTKLFTIFSLFKRVKYYWSKYLKSIVFSKFTIKSHCLYSTLIESHTSANFRSNKVPREPTKRDSVTTEHNTGLVQCFLQCFPPDFERDVEIWPVYNIRLDCITGFLLWLHQRTTVWLYYWTTSAGNRWRSAKDKSYILKEWCMEVLCGLSVNVCSTYSCISTQEMIKSIELQDYSLEFRYHGEY